jgi:DNA-binding IclR family transcriptional regulator
MAGNSTESGRSVTSKITSILMTFTEGSVHSLTEIARLAGLSVSTAHRLTSELASWRLLERLDDGQYRVGLPLRMIGTGGTSAPSVAERAPWVLEDLAAATRSRARLGVLAGLDVAYIEKQPGHRPVSSFSAAATLPAHPTALGRALLAVADLGRELQPVMAALSVASRSLSRELATSPPRIRAVASRTLTPGVPATAGAVRMPGREIAVLR